MSIPPAMTVRRLACIVVVGVLSITENSARQGSPAARVPARPIVVPNDRHDVSPALRDIPALPPGQGAVREIPRQARPTRQGPRSRAFAPDPVAQTAFGTSALPAPGRSFEGVGNVNSVLPPDANGAVGPNHYVQWVNLSFAIFTKGSDTTPPALLYGPAAGNTLWKGFGGPCESTNNGDPVVLYDHLADRWFMTQLAIPNMFGGVIAGPFYQCLAVSATPDPTGAYYRYQFSFAKLNDYPKFAVWPDAYYMTMNQFTSVSLAWAGQGVVAYDRRQMLAGLPTTMVYFDLDSVDVNLGGMLPADLDGPAPARGSPAFFAQVDDDAWGYAPDELQIWQFHVDWTQPSASTFTGPARATTAAFDTNLCGYSRTCIPQPQTTAGLDALSDRLMYRLQYRNFGDHESLVVNHTVDVDGTDHAGVRWYEVRDPRGAPAIYQQGTYAPDADNRWMASAAMDGAGDIALGFSVSGRSTAPSIRYTGRAAGDPPGSMTQGEAELMPGGGSQTSPTGRWGDYSLLAVDPVDDCTFWYTQEYYAATSDAGWHTRVGSFAFPSCATAAARPSVTVAASVAAAAEAGQVPGAFTFTRTGDLSAPLTASYSVAGTATPGSDYLALPGVVTFAAGQSTANVSVEPIDDTLVEPVETVFVTVNPDPSYLAGLPSEAVVTIMSDDAPPDLLVSALTVPSVGGAGMAITVTDTTLNQATAPSPASLTGFYLSTDFSLDGTDVFLGSRSVPALAAGAASTGSTSLTIPSSTASGTYYLIAKADFGNAVPETQEGNNTRWSSFRIGPDLTISALTSPSRASTSGSIVVSDTTANTGGGGAAASTTSFYLSTDFTLGPNDPLLGSRTVPALAPGTTSAGSTTIAIPAGTQAGTYYIFAKADSGNDVAESQEGNNTRFSSAVFIGPDLVVSSVSGPAVAGAGDSVAVNDTTKNQGLDAAGVSTTAFYLSTNITFDASDVPIGGRDVPALAAGASSSASTVVQIPASTPTGTYYVLARADANTQVVESIETNNVSFTTIRIGPDLVVSSLTVPFVVGAGDTVVFNDTTKNQGASAADGSTTGFYLSKDITFDASDVPLGTRAVPPLTGGATSAAATTVQIPAGTASGMYYVLAKADAANQIVESVETNNVAFAAIRVGPDLAVSAMTAPSTATAASVITVSDTTVNQGGSAASASTTQYFLSTNLTLDASDVLLGSRAVDALAAGASSTGSVAITLPSGLAAGTYYIIAVADGTNAVIESVETNNTRTRAIGISPP